MRPKGYWKVSAVFVCLVGFGLYFGSRSWPQRQEALSLSVPSITHGPVVGKIEKDSATIWLRTDDPAEIVIEVSRRPNFSGAHTVHGKTKQSNDNTVKILLPALSPDTDYFFRIRVEGQQRGATHRLRTAPSAPHAPFKFAVLSDFNCERSAPVFDAVNQADPDVLIFLGDLDHRKPLVSLDQFRSMHKDCLGSGSLGEDFVRNFINRFPRPVLPFIHVWDDHDFGANNSDRNLFQRSTALQAFEEYFVLQSHDAYDEGKLDGVWQRLRYGDADVFVLDARSNRDPKEVQPRTGNTSMLGPRQKEWLERDLLRSRARWKIILSPVPFNPSTKPEDGWGLFVDERMEILNFIAQHRIKGVIIGSGDIHSGGAVDSGANSGIPEVSIPHANLATSYADTVYGRYGTWDGGYMSGAAGAGYVLFEGNARQLEVTVRDERNAVRNGVTLFLGGKVELRKEGAGQSSSNADATSSQ